MPSAAPTATEYHSEESIAALVQDQASVPTSEAVIYEDQGEPMHSPQDDGSDRSEQQEQQQQMEASC